MACWIGVALVKVAWATNSGGISIAPSSSFSRSGCSGGEVTLGGDRRFPIMTGALGQGSERDE